MAKEFPLAFRVVKASRPLRVYQVGAWLAMPMAKAITACRDNPSTGAIVHDALHSLGRPVAGSCFTRKKLEIPCMSPKGRGGLAKSRKRHYFKD